MDASRHLKPSYTLKYMYLCVEVNRSCVISADLELTSHRAGSRDKRRRASLESELTEPRQAVPGPVKTYVGQSPKRKCNAWLQSHADQTHSCTTETRVQGIYRIIRSDRITRESDEIVRIIAAIVRRANGTGGPTQGHARTAPVLR